MPLRGRTSSVRGDVNSLRARGAILKHRGNDELGEALAGARTALSPQFWRPSCAKPCCGSRGMVKQRSLLSALYAGWLASPKR